MGAKTHKKWRIYADHNIEQEITRHMREEDFDVLAVSEQSDLRRQQDDKYHYEEARKLGRYSFAHDDDFWDDRRFPLQRSPGVVVIAKDQENLTKYFPVLLRRIVERDYNIDGGPRHLGGVKVRMTWDGINKQGKRTRRHENGQRDILVGRFRLQR